MLPPLLALFGTKWVPSKLAHCFLSAFQVSLKQTHLGRLKRENKTLLFTCAQVRLS